MSKISWISFPRSAETSVIRSMVDNAKTVWVENPVGTNVREYFEYQGDREDLAEIGLSGEWDAHVLERVFDNPFVYELYGDIGIAKDFYRILDTIGISKEEIFYFSTLGEDDLNESWRVKNKHMMRELREEVFNRFKNAGYSWVWLGARCTKQLYDLIKHNTKQGEVAEIYSFFVRGEVESLGPPKKTTVVELKDMLMPGVFTIRDTYKIVILNTGEQIHETTNSPLLDAVRSNIREWVS